MEQVLAILNELAEGFGNTLLLFAVTLIFAFPLGLLFAFGSMSKFKPLKWLMKTLIWVIRGTPLMLQILLVSFLPQYVFRTPTKELAAALNMTINATMFLFVALAFIINYACYFSEIYRGGIESISRGQYEAGYVLGLTKKQVFRNVVLKQVVKRIVPPMSNEIITLIKDTALANCIMLPEIIKQAKELAATQALVWPLFYTGLFYLIFVGFLTIVLGKIEKKLDYFRS